MYRTRFCVPFSAAAVDGAVVGGAVVGGAAVDAATVSKSLERRDGGVLQPTGWLSFICLAVALAHSLF